MRARRSQHWCRTEDVRTITEEDTNADRWKIGTPPGIGNEGERSRKGVVHGDLFVFESTGRTVQYKLNAQYLRLIGLHRDVNDAHRARANRLRNKQTVEK